MSKKRAVKNQTYAGYTELKEMKEQGLMKNLENIKHPTTILEYTKPAEYQSIEKEAPLITYGVDVETDKKGNLMLLGIYYPNGDYKKTYGKTPVEYVKWLANFVWHRTHEHKSGTACMVAWRELDGIIIYKTMLQALGIMNNLTVEEQFNLLYRYGHVEGRFEKGVWKLEPVIKLNTTVKEKPTMEQDQNGNWIETTEGIEVEFGILQAIKGSICLFIRDITKNSLKKIWMFDISDLQKGNLEEIANLYQIPYKKGEERYHIVDWEQFKKDEKYRRNVIFSNLQDARTVKEIADRVSEHFSQVFFKSYPNPTGEGWVNSFKYPNGFWSTGTLTTFALSMLMSRKDFMSLNWTEQLKDWLEEGRHDQELIGELYCMSVESFKAGLIEEYARGTAEPHEKVYVSDITSAYPFVMKNLFDLRYSTITKGTGKDFTPPKWNEYLIMRCKAEDVPYDAIHSVGIKEPRFEEMKIHPSGDFIATALYEEWELLKKTGAKVTILEWVKITTNGQPHPLAKVIDKMFRKRKEYLGKMNNAIRKKERAKTKEEKEKWENEEKENKIKAETIKIVMNGIYGKMFEATRKFIEIEKEENEETKKVLALAGFKAGQLFNPLLATIITGYTRVRIVEKALEITENGGQVIMALTDSLHWIGNNGKEMKEVKEKQSILARHNNDLQYNGWTNDKELGMWEKPKRVYDYMAVGTGRYQYRDEKGELTLKLRGMMLNVLNYQQEATNISDKYQSLKDMVQEAIKNGYRKQKGAREGEPCIRFKQRILGNPAYALHELDINKLGVIEEVEEEAVLHVVYPKRIIHEFGEIPTLEGLAKKMFISVAPSKEAYVETIMEDDWDGTLKPLREKMKDLDLIVWETEQIKREKQTNRKKIRDQIRRKQYKELAKFLGITDDAVKQMISTLKNENPNKTGLEQVEELAKNMGFDYSDELKEFAQENGVNL